MIYLEFFKTLKFFQKKNFYRLKSIFILVFPLLPRALLGQIFFRSPVKTLPNSMPRVDFEQKKLQPKSFVRALSQYTLVYQTLKTCLGCVECVKKGAHQVLRQPREWYGGPK